MEVKNVTGSEELKTKQKKTQQRPLNCIDNLQENSFHVCNNFLKVHGTEYPRKHTYLLRIDSR